MRTVFLMPALLCFVGRTFAAAVPVTPTQNAVSGVVQAKMAQRGFARNDPRWSATLESAGAQIAGTAVGAAVVTAIGVASAPAWFTVALGAGIGYLFIHGLGVAVDAVQNWIINANGTITISSPHDPYPTANNSWYGLNAYWNGFPGSQSIKYFPTLDALCGQYWAITTHQPGDHLLASGGGACRYFAFGANQTLVASRGNPDPNYSAPGEIVNGTPQQAINTLTPAQLAEPVNPAIIAAVANNAWQNAAAQPGYAGYPYVATNPVTSTEAASWQQANPSAWPTVGNFVAPQPVPSGSPAATPWQLPNTAEPATSVEPGTNPNPSTNPAAANPLQNLGPDPGVGAPTLETTPTAQMILNPLLNLFPSLKTFTVPNHSGVCPRPSMQLFDRSVVLEAHCDVLEGIRAVLAAAMTFVWAVAALFIVLRA